MRAASTDFWDVMSTARTIRRFTDEPVDDLTLSRCLQAATWAPSCANAQRWRFIVLRSPEQRAVVAEAAARALTVIEPVYGMSRPAAGETGRQARNRANFTIGRGTSPRCCSRRGTIRPHRSCCSAARSSRRCRTSPSPRERRDSVRARPAGRHMAANSFCGTPSAYRRTG